MTMAEPQWRPYRFTGLPKYTRESASLLASFSRYLSVAHQGPLILQAVSRAATELFRQPVRLHFDHLSSTTFDALAQTVPENACLVRVGLQPKAEKILWELDPVLAAGLIERLLGGRGEDVGLSRPFTDIERGVLTYGLLKLGAAFQTTWSEGGELAVRIEGLEQSIDALRPVFSDELVMHSINVKVSAGSIVGFSRILIPHTLTAGAFSLPDEPEGTDAFWAHARRNLSRIGEQSVLARARIATLDLTPEDIEQLDVGDIVLLEHHQLQGSGSELSGNAEIRIARGRNGVLRTQLIWRNGRLDLQINEIALEEEPQAMADEEDINAATEMQRAEVEAGDAGYEAAPNDNLQEAEGLLRDVPAPVVVELGRLKMSTSQVIRLKAGQIIRLGRSPTDTVDLVVNNRIFARGELIEVDGEIGVRLVQLAK
jgi:type III secretion system YscQ/HrcQ family protein